VAQDLEGAKRLLSPDSPFIIGGDPDRVAPAHVINGYLAALFGSGSNATQVRQSMRGKISLPATVSGEIRDTERKRVAFRDALRTILDPDHRVFPSGQGSTFPLNLGLIAPDRSDDGLGKELATLVTAIAPDAIDGTAAIFRCDDATDAVMKVGEVLASSSNRPPRSLEVRSWPWDNGGGRLGAALSRSLGFLAQVATQIPNALPSVRLAMLTRSVYLAIYIGLARSPALMARQPKNWNDLAPMFFLGVQPPGNPRSPEGRLAIRSFDAVVAECSESIRDLIASKLARAGRGITQNMPPSERARIRVGKAFSGLSAEHAALAVQALRRHDKPEAQARALSKLAYPAGYVSDALRSTGRMIGCAGPDRGAGAPRFLIETPLLALLVSATADEVPTPYPEWLDRVFDRFGIIFGFGETHDPRTSLASLDEKGPVERALRSNHEALRSRLVRAGLAVEYSDGETEVMAREQA
jgi:hypothetical protein